MLASTNRACLNFNFVIVIQLWGAGGWQECPRLEFEEGLEGV